MCGNWEIREKVGGGPRSLVNRTMVDKLFDKITDWKGKKKNRKARTNYRNVVAKRNIPVKSQNVICDMKEGHSI